MTTARIGPGLRELRSRHGALFGTGDLYTVVTLWRVSGSSNDGVTVARSARVSGRRVMVA